jgi:threonine aldolase
MGYAARMIPPELMNRYRQLVHACDFRLTGQRPLSMSAQLEEIGRWTQHYEQQDVYGTGELIESFTGDIARLLDKPAAVFLPSGTMAQCIALRIWAEQAGTSRVGFHATSHLELHEKHAYRELHGLDGIILGDADRVVTLDDLVAAGEPLAAVLLELPMREIGGQLPAWEELKAQSDWARHNAVALHMDGARLWQCTSYYQRSMADIAALFDSVYVSFYKDIGGIAGSVLAGPEAFIEEAKTWISRAGGNLYSFFPYVLAARAGMERNLGAIPKAVAAAGWLADFFRAELGLETTPANPPTNLFHLKLRAEPDELLAYAIDWTERHKIFLMPSPNRRDQDTSILEFSMGTAFRALGRDDWKAFLLDFYGDLAR